MVEALFLAFFVVGLLIRIGNPDLWHPFKGGEKPMDFSYFNAILKSSTFPPYDPWFAGGYINYYYYGFVLLGVIVKWLGIVPSIAINMILPTLFSLIALGAFSITWNLVVNNRINNLGVDPNTRSKNKLIRSFIPAVGGALGMVVLGNLGTLRMIYHGLQRLGSPEGVIEGAGLVTQFLWAIKGLIQSLLGTSLPYSLADWYWIPSRAIPVPSGEVQPITEFPFFTVLYADPHAHLFALPLTLLALAWAISFVFSKGFSTYGSMSKLERVIGVSLCLLLGGMAIGVLRPTNTWDLPTFLALGVVAIGYSIGRYFSFNQKTLSHISEFPSWLKRGIVSSSVILILIGLAFLLFQPYAYWYVQAYTSIEFWQGSRTPFWSYMTHWGLFLFVITTWMVWETRDWMANTPLSELRKITQYRSLIIASLLVLLFAVIYLLSINIGTAWLVLPIATWAGILILRPRLPDAKRIVLFLFGTGIVLTLFVDIVRLEGDIGRMNTVFKFYLQTWTLFAVSGAAALGWLLSSMSEWSKIWRKLWYGVFIALIISAALFPVTASIAKVKDRMATQAPPGLDGMAFMQYATYFDADTLMDLSQDYHAIRWLQENVQGSQVIVEANVPEYRWGTRYTIYTGLPNVIGWNWHQRQQRPVMHDQVWQRVGEVSDFYLTTNIDEASSFLQEYNVKYIILGQLERAYYPGPGLDKFDQYEGAYWQMVYSYADTTIYKVDGNYP
jgi:YYY domain-containing protein